MPRRAYIIVERETILKSIFMILYLALNGFVFYRTYSDYRDSAKFSYIYQLLGASLCISRGSADVILLNAGALLLPMSKVITTLIRNMNRKLSRRTFRSFMDAGKRIHMFCVYLMFIATAVHVIGHLLNACRFSRDFVDGIPGVNAAAYKHQDPLWIVLPTVPGSTGIVLVIILVIMFSGSRRSVRYSNHILFQATHKLFLPFYALLLVHGMRGVLRMQTNTINHDPACHTANNPLGGEPGTDGGQHHLHNFTYSAITAVTAVKLNCTEEPHFAEIPPQAYLWLSGPLFIGIIDFLIRFIRRSQSYPVTGVRNVGSDIIKLFIKVKTIKTKPGQYMFIRIPKLSATEWHPFSIVDTEQYDKEHNEISFYIHTEGHWTTGLKQLAHQEYRYKGDMESPRRPVINLKACIDGPFGSPLGDVLRYQVSLCVAGGVGITPFLSYVNYIRRKGLYFKKTQALHIIWTSRNLKHFEEGKRALEDLSNSLATVGKEDMLTVQFCLTGESNKNITCSDGYVSKRLRYGRMDWVSYMSQLANQHQRCSIGVFTCASRMLNSSVQSASEKFDNIIFSKESF